MFMASLSVQKEAVVLSDKITPNIIVTAQATPQERLAAKELAYWLGRMTGRELKVIATDYLVRNSIIVGAGHHARTLLPNLDLTKLGNEEVLIKSENSFLVVAGGGTRGTIYAVNRLLHREGVRWWTPWATQVPHKSRIEFKNLDIREKPVFEARSPFWYHAFDRDWARRNNSNADHARLTDEDGGKVKYAGFVHTFYDMVPPKEHFAKHPEWFSLIDGKRKWEGAQLCTTNPELRDFIVEKVKERIRQSPGTAIVSVSQNDWYGACQCDICSALDNAEGTNAASVLALANYVAEKIEPEFPNVAIDTLAYQYTRKAPKTMKPRPNVIVRLCSIECNFSQPLEHESNKDFARDIRDWSRLTNRLYVWNYVTDFPNYMLPFPNWYTVGPNERFFAANGVKGLFEQGAYQSYGSEMAEMEAWVQAQLLWNPNQDDRKLIAEFLRGYYGKAANPIQQYLNLMANAAKNTTMGIWVGPDAPFLTLDTMLKAEALWKDAERRVSGDKDLLWRVRVGHLPVRYVFLSRWIKFRREASERKLQWPLSESRKAVADSWIALATNATKEAPEGWTRITHMNEGGTTPENWAERFAVDPEPLPNRGTAKLPSDLSLPAGAQVIDIQDSDAKLYGEGNLVDLRGDALASDGIAARMPGSHYEWAVQFGPELTGKYRVFVVGRVEGETSDAVAFTAGVYSADSKKGLGQIAPKVKEANAGYRSFELGTFDLSRGCYIWVAPTGTPAVKAVWIDRVLLLKA